jgi:oligopeptide transport system ATP-binding protein
MEPLLEVTGLRIEFPHGERRFPAVEDVSFAVGRGERVALVGESGSGKSLCALALLRLVPPPGEIAAGTVRFRGRDVLRLPEKELRAYRGKDVAMVFQEPAAAFNPVLTVGFQITEGILAHEAVSKREAEKRAEEMLGLVGLPDPKARLRSYPHELSGGMRQRALLAVALACRPALLIADEPTTALDVTVQAQILDLLLSLQERFGMAVLLITHDLGVVARFASRVYVMYAGRVVEEAKAAALFRLPMHPYTHGLLASVPRMDRREARLSAIPGAVPSPQNLPPGCAFAPRCPWATEECSRTVPSLAERGESRRARCVLSMEELPWRSV